MAHACLICISLNGLPTVPGASVFHRACSQIHTHPLTVKRLWRSGRRLLQYFQHFFRHFYALRHSSSVLHFQGNFPSWFHGFPSGIMRALPNSPLHVMNPIRKFTSFFLSSAASVTLIPVPYNSSNPYALSRTPLGESSGRLSSASTSSTVR